MKVPQKFHDAAVEVNIPNHAALSIQNYKQIFRRIEGESAGSAEYFTSHIMEVS
jgi:hypothetical protein